MIADAFRGLPPELSVFMLSMVPVGELRVAIPVAMLGYKMSALEAFLIAQAGNAVPVLLVYGVGMWWVRWVERRKGFLHRLTDKVLRRAHDRLHGDVSKWGLVALTLFVGIPLPLTGAWTGALGAFVLQIPFRRAAPAIIAGNVIAGVIMTLAAGGAVAAFKVFL